MRKPLLRRPTWLYMAALLTIATTHARAQDAGAKKDAADVKPTATPTPTATPAQAQQSPAPAQQPTPAADKAGDDAIAAATKLIAADPKNAAAYFQRAMVYVGRQDYSHALADLNAAVDLKPANMDVCLYNRGLVHEQQGDLLDAIQDYNDAFQANPNYAEAYFHFGVLIKEKGDEAQAFKSFTEAIRVNPKFAPAYAARSSMDLDRSDLENGLADANKAVELDPADARAHFARGDAMRALGDMTKTAADYAEAVRLDPKYAEAWRHLAWLLATSPDATLRDGKKAVDSANKAHDLADPKDNAFLPPLAAAYAEAGDFAQAVKWETQYLQSPDLGADMASGSRRRLALYRQGKPFHAPDTSFIEQEATNAAGGNSDVALADFTKQIEADPENANAFYNRGVIYGNAGASDKAIADYTEAIRLDPEYPTAYINRGNEYKNTGEYDKALADLNEAVRLEPAQALPFVGRGLIYSAMGNTEKATADFQEAVRIDPSNATGYFGLGFAAHSAGDWDKAMDYYAKSIAADFQSGQAYENRGSLYRQTGEAEKALADLDQAILYDSNPNDALPFYYRALLFQNRGDFAKAVPDFQEAIRRAPGYTNACNVYSFLLATCPDPAFRDGKKAVEIAGKLCAQSEWKVADYIDTLATASAEAGDFNAAVKYETLCLTKAGISDSNRADYQKRLALFHAKKPWHSTASVPPPIDDAELRIRINASINGQTVRLIYDTGAGSTVISKDAAKRLGLTVTPPAADKQPPAPGEIAPDFTTECNFALGSNVLNRTLAVYDVPAYLGASDMEGFLSWSELNSGDEALLVDAAKRTISRAPLPPDIDQWKKWKIAPDSDILILEGGEGNDAVKIGIDSGDDSGILLNPARWKKWRGDHASLAATPESGWYPAEHMFTREILRAPEIAVGPMHLQDVPVSAFSGAGVAGFRDCDAVVGLFGLTRLQLLIDRKNGFAYTRPSAYPTDRYAYDHLGVIFTPKDIDDEKDNDLFASVMKGSPADRAGVRDGDILTGVNDNDITHWRTDPDVKGGHAWGGEPGEKIKLQLKRDGKPIEFTVTTEDYEATGWKPVKNYSPMQRGLQAREHGDTDLAVTWFNETMDNDSKDAAAACYQLSQIYDNAGAKERALKGYGETIRLDPKYWQAYLDRGNIYTASSDYDKAIADFDEAVRLAPGESVAVLSRGNAYDHKGDPDKALADFTTALRLDPKSSMANYNCGTVYEAKGDYDEAIKYLDAAIRLDPSYMFSYNNRGLSWAGKNDYKKAIADYDVYLASDPGDSEVLANRGRAHEAAGEHDKAIADFTESLRISPDNLDNVIRRGNAYDMKGDREKALQDFLAAVRIDPKSALADYDCAMVYNEQSDYTIAIEYFDQAINLDPKDADSYRNRGKAYTSKGDYDKAIADLDKAIQLTPDAANFYIDRGNAYDDKGSLDKALADFSEAAQLDPKSYLAIYNCGTVYSAKNDYPKAIDCYSQALRITPGDTDSLYYRGSSYTQVASDDKAMADFNEVIRIDPKYAGAYIQRGQIRMRQHDYARAFADYDKGIEIAPNDATSYGYRGYAYEERGEFEKALADYNKTIELNPQDAANYNSVAWLTATCSKGSIRNGAVAVENAKKACELSQWKDPGYIDTLAAAYAESGDFKQAIQFETQCIAFPDVPKENIAGHSARLALYQQGKAYHQDPPK